MRTIKNSFLTMAFISIFLAGCKNNERNNHLSYHETQCSNPWINYVDETEHKNNVLSYLSTNGVNATDIELEFVSDSVMVCAACSCPSGTRVDIWVEDEDVAEANALGFY